jgi:hypothetical protein
MLPLCHARKGSPNVFKESCCNNSKYAKAPSLWLIERLGNKKAQAKLAEIRRYFIAADAYAASREGMVSGFDVTPITAPQPTLTGSSN